MKVGIFPGSFNPWHDGHRDIVTKALQVFDKVIIAKGINPFKSASDNNISFENPFIKLWLFKKRIEIVEFEGLLADFVNASKADAVIRGLRSSSDFEFEKDQLYWNEDLGLKVPFVYFISDRKYCHISSSAIRALDSLKKKE